jgi:hypothetical protein
LECFSHRMWRTLIEDAGLSFEGAMLSELARV